MTTVGSLYAGCGGLDFGFRRAGFSVKWANDNDDYAMRVHEREFPETWQWVQDFSIRGIPARCDVVIGGPPCQPFSRGGNQLGHHDVRARHVLAFADAVSFIKPVAFVMENVPDLAASGRYGALWATLMGKFHRSGFAVTSEVLDAYDYGVPQHRKRLFITGFQDPRRFEPYLLELSNGTSQGGTVREVLSKMPPWGHGGNDITADAKIVLAKNPVLRASPYAGMLLNGARPLDLEGPSTTIPAIMGGNKTPVIDYIALEHPKYRPWIELYHKGQRSGWPQVSPAPVGMRRITAQEAAALQDFPNGYAWGCVPPSAAFRMIGNAVPPGLSYAVARAVMKALRG